MEKIYFEVSTNGDFCTKKQMIDLNQKFIPKKELWYLLLFGITNNLLVRTNDPKFENQKREPGYKWLGLGDDCIALFGFNETTPEREFLRKEIDRKILRFLRGRSFSYKVGTLGRAEPKIIKIRTIKQLYNIGLKDLHGISLVK